MVSIHVHTYSERKCEYSKFFHENNRGFDETYVKGCVTLSGGRHEGARNVAFVIFLYFLFLFGGVRRYIFGP